MRESSDNPLPSELLKELNSLRDRVGKLEARIAKTQSSRYIAKLSSATVTGAAPFMAYSTCSAADFLHPRYHEIIAMMKRKFHWHRKQWEFVFVIHHLLQSGLVKPGGRGLVFGVGNERLPALFASMGAEIVATDAPQDIASQAGWAASNQHAANLSAIRHLDLVDADTFDSRVSYRTCDMNNIPPELSGFDFNWSSCCFEHLGSLEAGMQFAINAVEHTLRPGGVAVHTTEFNLSSNSDTIERGGTVLYRRRDLQKLTELLQARGHLVSPFLVAPDAHYYDFHVDVPPFSEDLHLKLQIQKYVCTSAGIVVRRNS
jgi:SAM-dependent methyltransferase